MIQKNQNDTILLQICINLAKKNRGVTSPNPSVGCIIVKNNTILATGVTSKGGRPHSEHNAISKIPDKSTLKGATLYVSLEPCCHHGQTLPCTDLVIDSGISRVVIAAIDNDKRVNGRSIKILEQKGVIVNIIKLKKAYEINKAFFKSKECEIPYLTLKIASSLDGKIALNNSKSKWITSEKSRKHGHYLRYINDAIMIGKNTLIKDDPSLDCRIKGLEDNNPTRIILVKKLDFDFNYKVFNSDVKTIVIHADNEQNKVNSSKFRGKNVEFLAVPMKNNLLDLKYCLKNLNQIGINSILIEGGSFTSTTLLQENLIDEINWFKSNKIIGSDGKSAIGEMNFTDMNEVISNFKLDSVKKIDDTDSLSVYKNESYS